MSRFRRRPSRVAFTLVELLVVITMIALLSSLAYPAFRNSIRKAQSVSCSQNLKEIGLAVQAYVNDNSGTYPEINQTAPPLPYDSSVPGLVGVLGAYGVTTNVTQCPVDFAQGSTSAFATYGSSYEWAPILDDEALNAPVVYPRPGVSFQINPARTRLCTDFNGIHNGRMNALYADGHVVAK
jgi:prepilin-type processing-associated H-X9-DG protein/prepilin-type N-terminal cleavage/methylation domain-containing protein